MDKKLKWGLVGNLILILLIAYGSTYTLNPSEIWAQSSTLIRIVLAVLTISTVLQFLALIVMSKMIPEDAECSDPDCTNKNIRANMPILNKVVRCYRCKRWYHKQCWIRFNKREPSLYELMQGCKICRGEETGRRRLFDDEDIFGQR